MCTLEKRGNIYFLTITGNDEHRLNRNRMDSIRSALDRIRSEATNSSAATALITTAEGKFFSNGFDLSWADNNPDRFILLCKMLLSLVRDLISLPMPTIAAVTGHASAAGIILALAHDYVLMRKDRGFLYMSDMDVKIVIPACFHAFLKCKIGSTATRRDLVMRAARLTATAAVEKGIIESAHDSAEETVKAALKLGEEFVGRKWDGQVYSQNRLNFFADVLPALDFYENVEDGKAADHIKTTSRL